jgi:hypothetical protein
MQSEIETGYEILLQTQLPDVERVAHILGVHDQVDFAVDRNDELGRLNIIAGRHIVFRIESEEVGVALVNLFRMERAEFPVRPRVVKVERKLSSLHLNRQSVGRSRLKVDLGPSLRAQGAHARSLHLLIDLCAMRGNIFRRRNRGPHERVRDDGNRRQQLNCNHQYRK